MAVSARASARVRGQHEVAASAELASGVRVRARDDVDLAGAAAAHEHGVAALAYRGALDHLADVVDVAAGAGDADELAVHIDRHGADERGAAAGGVLERVGPVDLAGAEVRRLDVPLAAARVVLHHVHGQRVGEDVYAARGEAEVGGADAGVGAVAVIEVADAAERGLEEAREVELAPLLRRQRAGVEVGGEDGAVVVLDDVL